MKPNARAHRHGPKLRTNFSHNQSALLSYFYYFSFTRHFFFQPRRDYILGDFRIDEDPKRGILKSHYFRLREKKWKGRMKVRTSIVHPT